MNKKQLDIYEQKLLDQQAELLGIAGLIEQAADSVKLDQTAVGRVSRVDAMQQQAMAVAAHARQERQLRRIKAALERLEDGEFGECLDCLTEIPSARIDIDPAIEFCVQCAK